MGFWLWRYFQSEKSFDSDATTEIWNLPRRGILSNLMIKVYALSGSAKLNEMLQDAISKIEVVGNGSRVIQSLSGQQVQASQAYDDGQMSPDKEYSPSGGCYGYFDIRFGRFPGDPLYALDCSKWASLELRITYNLAAGGTLGTTGYTTATGKFTIYGLFSPDGAGLAPLGYLKKAQKKSYTTVANSEEDLELPTDYPFRRLLLLSATKPSTVWTAFDDIDIDINDGARKPLDTMDGEELMIFDLAMRGNPIWECYARYYLADTTNYVIPRIGWIKTNHWLEISGTVSRGITGLHRITVTSTAAAHVEMTTKGYLPDKAMAIDLEKWSGGKHGEEAMMECFGYNQSADIHFKHTQKTADYASSIVLEQYASHPVPA